MSPIQSQNIAKQTLHLVNGVGNNLLLSKELYEKPTAFNTKSLSMVLDRQVPSKIGDKLIKNAGMGIFLPPSNVLFGGKRTKGSSVSTQVGKCHVKVTDLTPLCQPTPA